MKKFLIGAIMIGATLFFNSQSAFAEISTAEITAENLSETEKEIY